MSWERKVIEDLNLEVSFFWLVFLRGTKKGEPNTENCCTVLMVPISPSCSESHFQLGGSDQRIVRFNLGCLVFGWFSGWVSIQSTKGSTFRRGSGAYGRVSSWLAFLTPTERTPTPFGGPPSLNFKAHIVMMRCFCLRHS